MQESRELTGGQIETDSAQQSFVVLLKTTSMQKMSHVGREDEIFFSLSVHIRLASPQAARLSIFYRKNQ